ncbi:DUF3597 domain-containing protein [Oecophyllibacter saccharovorans]|uniref:DUF3597 domain-containing protein n=1 Tax=Oecophyllibacter saccharovorans TaxID=2558360 RepID=UPI00116D98D7|nr:DUF3597 domain-containing protein [Oecophyllibacter saccharovorans]TPW33726.1 DUF3597 domain-containing protein [Oecophyllibacter saccharovorans]
MGLLSDIWSKIVHIAHADAPQDAAKTTGGSTDASSAPAGQQAPVDVSAILAGLAAKSGEQLNYQTSIVDLLKLLGLNSSLEARRELATELHYPGDMNDTAAMNTWLIRQVYAELAKNGGKIPAGWAH